WLGYSWSARASSSFPRSRGASARSATCAFPRSSRPRQWNCRRGSLRGPLSLWSRAFQRPRPVMSDRPVPQPGILEIAPYVPGRSQAAPGVTAVKLSANESPLGASPAALAALAEASARPDIYPEGTSRLLREALGEVHGLDPELIVCGNGSDDLLHLLAQCYL